MNLMVFSLFFPVLMFHLEHIALSCLTVILVSVASSKSGIVAGWGITTGWETTAGWGTTAATEATVVVELSAVAAAVKVGVGTAKVVNTWGQRKN